MICKIEGFVLSHIDELKVLKIPFRLLIFLVELDSLKKNSELFLNFMGNCFFGFFIEEQLCLRIFLHSGCLQSAQQYVIEGLFDVFGK